MRNSARHLHMAIVSERHADAGVFQAHGQDAFVDLVELNQLQEVNEERQSIVYGEVLPASVFALQRGNTRPIREVRNTNFAPTEPNRNSRGSPGSV